MLLSYVLNVHKPSGCSNHLQATTCYLSFGDKSKIKVLDAPSEGTWENWVLCLFLFLMDIGISLLVDDSEGWPEVLGSYTHMSNQAKTACSQVGIIPALAIVVIWGVILQMENHSFSIFSLSLIFSFCL